MFEGAENTPGNQEFNIPHITEADLPSPSPETSIEVSPTTDPKVDILQNAEIAEKQGRDLDGVAWRKLLANYDGLLLEHPGEFAVFGELGPLRIEKDQKDATYAADQYSASWSRPVALPDGRWRISNTAGLQIDYDTLDEALDASRFHEIFPPDPHVFVYELKQKLEVPIDPFSDYFKENPPDEDLSSKFRDLFETAIATGDFSSKPLVISE